MKKLIATIVATTMLLSLTACSSNNDNNNKNNGEATPTAEQETTMRTITDVKGEVEIPADPKRIVDISGASDILSILGYHVVGTANSDAYDYTKFPTYLEDVLSDATIVGYSMQDTMDVEGILSLEPDLIIMSTYQEKMYDQLKEVAPTVMIELAQMNWKEDLMNIAKVMDQEAKATEWLESYEAKATEVGEKVKEKLGQDTTYLSFLASGGQIFIFDGAGIGSILYEDMGLAKPEGMPTQENVSLPVVTNEGLAAIDADYILAIGTEEDMATLTKSSIWKNMNAVKENKVISLPSSPYFNQGYSPIGRLLFLEEIESLLNSI